MSLPFMSMGDFFPPFFLLIYRYPTTYLPTGFFSVFFPVSKRHEIRGNSYSFYNKLVVIVATINKNKTYFDLTSKWAADTDIISTIDLSESSHAKCLHCHTRTYGSHSQ